MKPYPRKCCFCGNVTVDKRRIHYNAEVLHHGVLHSFQIVDLGIDRCRDCGEQFFTSSTDAEIHSALQDHLMKGKATAEKPVLPTKT